MYLIVDGCSEKIAGAVMFLAAALISFFSWKFIYSDDLKSKKCKSKLIVLIDFVSAVSLSSIAIIEALMFGNKLYYAACFFIVYIFGTKYLFKYLVKNKPVDELSISIINFLCCFGILVLFRIKRYTGFAQLENLFASLICFAFCYYFTLKNFKSKEKLSAYFSYITVFLLVLPIVFGREINGAKAWISLPGMSFQPSEFGKITSILSLVHMLKNKKIKSALAFSVVCLLLLVLQKDLGTALIYFSFSFVLIFYVHRDKKLMLLVVLLAIVGSFAAYYAFPHVQKRLRIWLNPWNDPNDEGYQIVKALEAMREGGLFGRGFGFGLAKKIPAHETDFIFSFIVNEFGMLSGAFIVTLYATLALRLYSIKKLAHDVSSRLILIAVMTSIFSQAFIIIAGNLKLIPLTGITLPFLSYGGSSLISSFGLFGIANALYTKIKDVE